MFIGATGLSLVNCLRLGGGSCFAFAIALALAFVQASLRLVCYATVQLGLNLNDSGHVNPTVVGWLQSQGLRLVGCNDCA